MPEWPSRLYDNAEYQERCWPDHALGDVRRYLTSAATLLSKRNAARKATGCISLDRGARRYYAWQCRHTVTRKRAAGDCIVTRSVFVDNPSVAADTREAPLFSRRTLGLLAAGTGGVLLVLWVIWHGLTDHPQGNAQIIAQMQKDGVARVVTEVARLDRVEVFRKGELSLADEGIQIASPDTAGGLKVVLTLSSADVYRLVLAGENLEGRTTLRLRQDEGDYRYLPAPDGRRKWTVTDAEKLEVLLYSDAPSRYRLESLSMTPCPQCPINSDRSLRDLIAAEVRQLAGDIEPGSFEEARALLDWVANRTDWSVNPAIVRETHPTISGSTAGEIYFDIFAPNKGAVWCGGSSVFLDKVLRLFGFDSFTINFGSLEGHLTHVTVIVALPNSSGDKEFYILDPTFNATFVDQASSQPLPVWELLERAETPGDFGTVAVSSRPVAKRDWLAIPGLAHTADQSICGDDAEEGDPYVICSRPNYSMDHYWSSFAESLDKLGFDRGPRGFFQMFRHHVFSVGRSADTGAREQFLRGLEERHISLAASTG